MNPNIIFLCIVAYFLLLYVISHITGKNDNNDTFFLGNRKSPWFVIAYGMIGTTLSGITFISVPGWVESNQFSYMQMVFGFFCGYFIISRILLPLYYKLGLTSIYTYLKDRFGVYSYKTGSSFFLISRTIGASFRLFLVATVLQFAVFDSWNIPFEFTVVVTIALIWLYTYRSGMKTIIWTDTLQTTFMLSTVIIVAYSLISTLDLSFSQTISKINTSDYSKIFFFEDWKDEKYFYKQFFSGVFMAIVMTGLDQDQMQKNLSCKNVNDAKKNMTVFSTILIFVDLLFLALGALLYIYSNELGINIPDDRDMLFPNIALNSGLPEYVGVLFIIGIIAAAYSSADSALTSLTTSFCVDIIEFEKQDKKKQIVTRKYVHLFFSLVLLTVILVFKALNDQSVVKSLFTVAGYTYGPLLGMFAFGLFTKFSVKDKCVPFIAVLSPIICLLIKNPTWMFEKFLTNENLLFLYSERLHQISIEIAEYTSGIGFELLIINGIITFIGLYIFKRKNISVNKS